MSRFGDRDRGFGGGRDRDRDRDGGSRYGGGGRFGGGGGFGGNFTVAASCNNFQVTLFSGGGSLKGKQPGGNLRAVNWDRVRLEPFEKNFYNATRESQNADPRVVEKFR